MKMLLVGLLALIALPASAADPLPRAEPRSLGLSPERLARIGATLETEVREGRMPGAVVAIARRGKLAYYEAFGFQDGGRTRPMTREAIFPIASMTKVLTGATLMSVLEEGRLSLNDPVGRFFPALGEMRVAVDGNPETTVPAARPIRLIDLARHTSGIVYGNRGTTAAHQLWQRSLGGYARMSGPAFIAAMAKLPLLHQPGTTWEYGLSIDVLGLVIEERTDKTLGEAMADRILRPLGMQDTGFVLPEDQRGRYATPLPTDPLTGRPQEVRVGLAAPGFEGGGGQAVSTAADYMRFAQMLLNGGTLDGRRVLSRKGVEEMTRDHLYPEVANNVPTTEPHLTNFGFGVTVAVRREGGSDVLGSPGMFTWNGAYGTAMWVDPKEELAVVYMASTPGLIRQHYRRVINALVYAAIED
ncbi:serine hydrolase domain-containing protein [Paeniroseomonas aquatica]|uniref:Serine hydrolase domain-containing protein n=1 Tax=Paeniroseomonas aquatica TaxID=373043 RepID=A0ABT8A479_9PROT|nr:serine hydrolase domain-containing protein [Paeniroseomonas aquatica]MDN3564587.1 serine hydrolase domain-containing protein [Paeniroseomonas aquatica]